MILLSILRLEGSPTLIEFIIDTWRGIPLKSLPSDIPMAALKYAAYHRSLLNEEIDKIQSVVRDQLVVQLNVELR